jgi:CheY-like chemotaxis protein
MPPPFLAAPTYHLCDSGHGMVPMPRVLVVDDMDEILKLVREVAQGIGYVTETLNNTLRFRKTFVLFKPDIVLLDIIMPNIDGIEIIRWLIDVDYSGRLIIMSGYADYDRMAQMLADAPDRMTVTSLPKPFRIAELRAALRGVHSITALPSSAAG